MKQFIFLFLFLLCVYLFSNDTLRPYRLINADSLLVEKKGEFYLTDLTGNVHFFYGSTEFYCDKALLNEETKITIMQGNVKVFEDTLSLFAQNSEYHRKKENIYLNNNVKIVQLLPDSTKNIFFADHITYNRIDSILTAQDNVKAISQKQKITTTCGFMKYNLKTHYGYLIKKPVIKKQEKNKTFMIRAEKIEYYDDYKKIVASFNVKTDFQDYSVTSNYLLYFSNEEKAVVIGNPKFYSDDAVASANQFILLLNKNKLKSADLKDSCRVYYKINKEDSLKTNYVFADKINILFNAGSPTELKAKGDVKTYYFQNKSKNRDYAKNYVNGDSLYFKIDKDKIKYIYLKNGQSGKYYFEK